MVNLLPYHVWLDVYQDELEANEVTDKQEAYQAYRDSFYEDAVDDAKWQTTH